MVPGTSKAVSAIAIRNLSAACNAVSAFEPGSITMNSSPPQRASISVVRDFPGHHRGELHQHLVPDIVAVCVIHFLEKIDVEQRQRQWCPVPRGACHLGGKRFVKFREAVVKAGQRVCRGLRTQILRQRLQLQLPLHLHSVVCRALFAEHVDQRHDRHQQRGDDPHARLA